MEISMYISTFLFTLILTLAIIPLFRKFAFKINLLDKPNRRKVHQKSVPLVGGLVIALVAIFTFLIGNLDWTNLQEISILILGGIALLIVGVIDDKINIRAIYKLLLQVILAHFAFVNGISIASMQGILGVYDLSLPLQYVLTLLVIVGTINAFNLLDGIDGLAGGIAMISFLVFSYLAFVLGKTYLIVLYVALSGAILGFLKFNFDKKQKIFLGDAGSLFLGFILIISGIILLKSSQITAYNDTVLAILIAVFALPVLDSLRVYLERIQEGKSPFEADKRHLHHLILWIGLTHRKVTFCILLLLFFYIVSSIFMQYIFGINFLIVFVLFLYIFPVIILNIHNKVCLWNTYF